MSKEMVVARGLPAEKQTALEMLLLGKSVAETARAAGVNRCTLFRWLKDDLAFQAAYNQWHEEMQESCRSRLLALTDTAVTAMAKALEAGDARTALQMLKGMGLVAPQPVRPTDEEELRRRAELDKKRRRQRHFTDELDAEVGMPMKP